ncbi:hypothetical protein LEMA_P057700.1 [Plenodomus lingam JN3]|uniref:Uncharacterized protein n=1 Tax=Leptosphaeria maculans (strain JN3 / isolate v23.1.3 / race Av1-4-5-6-7-8) TaxID=985895 RepID=E4ZI75_LEPMJ|nr:hypothetical protein LEMA_P057700.1 [Plenodomus lingam JN3]CBX90736.1 hypothetical protein LEMA_P057700.1 [Plenodomus lingam JN3]
MSSLKSFNLNDHRSTIALVTSFLILHTLPLRNSSQWPLYHLSTGILRAAQRCIYLVIFAKLVKALNGWISHRSYNNFIDDPSWNWPNELAIVTGGSSGIGAEIVCGLAKHQIRTIILDINPPSTKLGNTSLLRYTYPAIYLVPRTRYKANQRPGNGVTFHQVDLSSPTAISTAATSIKASHGHPSILINNAGTGTAQTILSESESERRRVFEVNALCHFTLVREFLPAMIEKDHGHVMTIASTGSFYAQAQNVAYAASKAAAMAFHEGLGQELRTRFHARRVRTSIIYPDFVRTPLVEALTSKVTKFPLAVMEPSEVAAEAVDAITSTYGHVIVLPRSLGYLALLRGLPPWVLRIVQTVDPDPLALVNE